MTLLEWGISFAFWLHMVATVIWIGGLSALSLFIIPARQSLEPLAYLKLLDGIQRKLDPVSWFSLATLAATGMFQLSSNPNYQGILVLNNRWAAAIFLKHLIFLAMTGISMYMSWGLFPKIRRVAFSSAKGLGSERDLPYSQIENRLIRLNFFLGILVLALTAVARVSS